MSTRTPDQGIRGTVLLGPVCPVETAESPCPPRPLADTKVQVWDEHGDVVATARTDRDGRFRIVLRAGTYSVAAVLANPGPPIPHQVQVVVRAHAFTDVTVPVDSGIRTPGTA